jgi:signal transduction histidine kinase
VERSTFSRGRWWDIFFAATMVLLSLILLQRWPEVSEAEVGALVTLAVISVAYAALGGPARRDDRFAVALAVILIVGAGTATAFYSSMATIQAIVFPLIWSLLGDVRRSIIANVALALLVGVTLSAALGGSADAIAQAVTIESISLVGSIALGIWFTRVEQLSDERQGLLDDLTAAQDQLAELHRDSGITSERERFAREIHDTIAQSLTGVIMLSQQAQRELASGDVELLADRLTLLETRARDALVETRSLVAAGAPVELGPGIGAALERLGERFARETGVAVTVGIDELVRAPGLLARDTEVVVLRCAQESLANIRKHSGASAATVELTISAESVVLTTWDNGIGFDPTAASPGFGLPGMRDRLALAGGTLEITSASARDDSAVAGGTSVRATLPVEIGSLDTPPGGAGTGPGGAGTGTGAGAGIATSTASTSPPGVGTGLAFTQTGPAVPSGEPRTGARPVSRAALRLRRLAPTSRPESE